MALRRTLRSALPVLLLALLLPLSACGAPADARPSSSASSATGTRTPTPDPRPTPASSKGPARNVPRPILPEAAKQNTEEGFEAFTQYWLDTVTYAFESGDVEPLKLGSAASCKVCVEFTEEARKLHTEGGWATGPRWTVQNFFSDMIRDPEGRLMGRYLGLESPSADYNSEGSIKRSFPGDPSGTHQEIYASFEADRWVTLETGNL